MFRNLDVIHMSEYKDQWFGNIKKDILAGIVVAIALIPEAVAFSLIAGVDPMVGLYSSFCIAIVTAFAGGRPGLISAATGSMALVLAGLVASHGIEYMLAATLLAGLIQVLLGYLKIGQLIRFIPRPVMLGFVNALAILIFVSQLVYFNSDGLSMICLVAIGILIIYTFPKINKTIPAPLVAILVLSALVLITGFDVLTIGDVGNISGSLPSFAFPDIPLNLETLKIILPYSISLALVGLIESLLTSRLIDDLTDTKSDKNRECVGQSLGNLVAGSLGGMAGCAMIGQSIINFKSGGRGRLSTLVSGVFLLILILFLSDYVMMIPMAALVAVMIVVSISTFDWNSVKTLRRVPLPDTAVMIATVVAVLLTDNLAIGVGVGIVMSALFFVNGISRTRVERSIVDGKVNYKCEGQLFFASTTNFQEKFLYKHDASPVTLDLSGMKLWDTSAAESIGYVIRKYEARNVRVMIAGLSNDCKILLDKSDVDYLQSFD